MVIGQWVSLVSATQLTVRSVMSEQLSLKVKPKAASSVGSVMTAGASATVQPFTLVVMFAAVTVGRTLS